MRLMVHVTDLSLRRLRIGEGRARAQRHSGDRNPSVAIRFHHADGIVYIAIDAPIAALRKIEKPQHVAT